MFSGSFSVPSPEIVHDHESVLAEILHLLRKQRVLPTVVSNAAKRPCAPGGPVSTWAVERTVRTIVPPFGFPTRELTRQSMSVDLSQRGPLWAKKRRQSSGKPASGLKPETWPILRSQRETRRLTPFGAGHRSTWKSRSRMETRDVPRFGSGRRAIRETSC